MWFLIDEQLPPDLARWLSAKGYPSVHVACLGLDGTPDDEIELVAKTMNAAVWSKDADFARRARQSTRLQVVWLRFGNIANAALRIELAPHLPAIATALKSGKSLVEIP